MSSTFDEEAAQSAGSVASTKSTSDLSNNLEQSLSSVASQSAESQLTQKLSSVVPESVAGVAATEVVSTASAAITGSSSGASSAIAGSELTNAEATPIMKAALKKAKAAASQAASGLTGKENRTISVTCGDMPQLIGQPALRFLSLTGEEELGELFTYVLELRTPDDLAVPLHMSANIDVKKLVGKLMTVSIELDGFGAAHIGAGKREITGLVAEAGFLRKESSYNVYTVTLHPPLWLASLNTDYRIFQNQSVTEIISTALADFPVAFEMRLDPSIYAFGGGKKNEPRAFQVQYAESTYNLVSRLAQEHGIYWFHEYKDGNALLVFVDDIGTHKPANSIAYHQLAYQPTGGKIDSEFIDEFNTIERIRPGKYVHNDFDFTRPVADLKASDAKPREHAFNNVEVYEWPGNYTDSKHADLLSRVRMEELRAEGTRATGHGNVRGLACGQTFTLTGHSHEAANQEYLLIKSKLVLHDIGEEAGSQSKYHCDNTFIVQPTSEIYRHERTAKKPLANGIQSAMVVGPAGKELWTDEFGRVRIRFLWDRNAKNDESDSCWVRVSQAWAGSSFGGIFIPRIGQEVMIQFLNSDPDKPLITGALYNQQTRPPWDLPDNATQSGFMSRSMKGGKSNWNGMRFEDKQGAEHYMVQAEKDMGTTVKNNENHSVGVDRKRSVGQDESVNIGRDRSEQIGQNHTLNVEKNQGISVTQDHQTKVGQNHQTEVGANYVLNVAESISIVCGKSSIYMDKSGTIIINGVKIEQTASAEHAINGEPVDINTKPAVKAKMSASGLFEEIGEAVIGAVEEVLTFASNPLSKPSVKKEFPPGVKDALANQKKALESRKTSLERWNDADKANFKGAFGSDSEAARQKILGGVKKELELNKNMTPDNFEPFEKDSKFNPENTYAYVDPKDTDNHVIHLGKPFYDAPPIGEDSKMGTLCHEMSHFNDVLGTDDIQYGRSKVIQLAKTNPEKALNNADTFEYYCEYPE